jgi:flagellar hook protein FlgE
MLTSLFTGVSGMNANGITLSTIGDNIANMNTIGFKTSRVTFGDILSQTLGGAFGSSQVGRGVMVRSVDPVFTQGSFETSANGLDLAIDGDGLFMVNDSGTRYYTRAGQFSLNKDGNIVNPDGLTLQGYIADVNGSISGTVGDLLIGSAQSPANITTTASVSVNLNSAATAPTAAFTLDGNGDGVNNDPANFNNSTTITVHDSQGGAHDVTVYFVKTAANAWTAHYVHQDAADANLLVEAGTQGLTFDDSGALVDDNSGTAVNFDFGAAVVTPQPIAFNYGTGTGEAVAGTGLDGATQFASDFSVIQLSQNGYSAGFLKNVSISEDGVITGIFTNGQTRAIGQVALAKFIAPTELTKVGRNLYAESVDSGQPIVGAAATSGIGRVLSNALEMSNVDLAEEFVRMITAQRGFQANSRVITTSDELLQELVNLKR